MSSIVIGFFWHSVRVTKIMFPYIVFSFFYTVWEITTQEEKEKKIMSSILISFFLQTDKIMAQEKEKSNVFNSD